MNATLSFTIVFGISFLVAGWFAYKRQDGLEQEDQLRWESETERRGRLAAQENLVNLENALRQVTLPEDIKRDIENARGPKVTVESFDVQQDELKGGRPKKLRSGLSWFF
jgi:hypothetical protein